MAGEAVANAEEGTVAATLFRPQSAELIGPKDFVVVGNLVINKEDSVKVEKSSCSEIRPLLQDSNASEENSEETSWSITCQVFIPFIIAGFGTVAAGIALDHVQHWTVFTEVPEMFVLVPALLGLKGNLEMTLASRLSTQANLGNVDSKMEQWKMATGNLSLLQCQGIVLGFLASVFAMAVGWIRDGYLDSCNATLLFSSSIATASSASLILGCITIGVVILSRKCNVNPDNVAAPISASLGDVTTLGLLATFSRILHSLSGEYNWIKISIICIFMLSVPLWAVLAYRNQYTQKVLYTGWVPVISAVAISSGGGYILNFAVAQFKGIAAFQPVINGVGGNLVAVQACRISTYLHQKSTLGVLPTPDLCISPCAAWLGQNPHARTARILMLIAIPGHLLFISCIHLLKADGTSLSLLFMCFYLCAALLQIALLLYIAFCIIHWMWRCFIDPDNSAIPYLTALGDLFGTALLYITFLVVESLSNDDTIYKTQ